MPHECRCEHPPATDLDSRPPAPAAAISADQTVAEVAHERPAARARLGQLGIDQCCGGGLTLREAAAAAGIPVDMLVGALDDAERLAR